MNKFFCGIDPGVNGALSILCYDSCLDRIIDTRVFPFKSFNNEYIAQKVELHSTKHGIGGWESHAFIEYVTGSVGEDDKGRSTRMFTFGEQYGIIQGIFVGRIKLEKVAAVTWQRALDIPKIKGEKKEDRKRRLKEEAQRRFPELKVTLATCDSLLIAQYGYLMTIGKLAKL